VIAFVFARDTGNPVIAFLGPALCVLSAYILLQAPSGASALGWRLGIRNEFFRLLRTVV
jgi:hypothetical protein